VSEQSFLLDLLSAGLVQCQVAVEAHGGVLAGLFVAGLVGSPSHCIGMCGPFVLSQAVARLEARPAAEMREFHRLAGAALVPYHLGRLTTYGGLGMLAAIIAGGMVDVTGMRSISALLLALAAAFFLGYALRKLGLAMPGFGSGSAEGESLWGRTLGRLARPLFGTPTGWRGYGLGLALGFLPCGLLYGALAAAASNADPLAAVIGTAGFAAGTVPALFAIGLAGHVAGRQWSGAVGRVAPVLMIINAGLLGFMAWRLLA